VPSALRLPEALALPGLLLRLLPRLRPFVHTCWTSCDIAGLCSTSWLVWAVMGYHRWRSRHPHELLLLLLLYLLGLLLLLGNQGQPLLKVMLQPLPALLQQHLQVLDFAFELPQLAE